MLIAGVVEVLAVGGVHDPLAQLLPETADDAISSQASDSGSRPADQVQSGAHLDLGAAVSTVELELPAQTGVERLPPSVLGADRPGFRDRLLRPPRPIA